MIELKSWLEDQGLTVRELAQELDVPLKTAQEWVYRGKAPSAGNQDRLTQDVTATCAHHWVIEASNGPLAKARGAFWGFRILGSRNLTNPAAFEVRIMPGLLPS